MSDSVQPHRWQPTRLRHPWDSPGKNTGVGCHFLLQCMKGKSESDVTQLCPTLCDPKDCSLPGSSVHSIFQARVLEWVASAFSTPCLDPFKSSTTFWSRPLLLNLSKSSAVQPVALLPSPPHHCCSRRQHTGSYRSALLHTKPFLILSL